MRYLVGLFRSDRPFWFRPSAIAAGFILAQYVEQFLRVGVFHSISGY